MSSLLTANWMKSRGVDADKMVVAYDQAQSAASAKKPVTGTAAKVGNLHTLPKAAWTEILGFENHSTIPLVSKDSRVMYNQYQREQLERRAQLVEDRLVEYRPLEVKKPVSFFSKVGKSVVNAFKAIGNFFKMLFTFICCLSRKTVTKVPVQPKPETFTGKLPDGTRYEIN